MFYYKNDSEITAWFGFEGQTCSAIDSFFTGKPSDYWIELLEDSQVCTFKNGDIEQLYQAHPEFERIGRLMVIENYLRLDERMKSFAFCTAEERYHRLLNDVPEALQRISLTLLASYLGVTAVTLSRIRAEYKN